MIFDNETTIIMNMFDINSNMYISTPHLQKSNTKARIGFFLPTK